MPDALIQELLKVRRLPTPSATALRILELAEQENVDLAEIARVISSDPAIAVRILKFANSSQLGAVRGVTTVSQAVLRLGIRAVKMTALSFSLLSQRDIARCPGFNADSFWSHSLAIAVAARAMIPARAAASGEEAFIVGLLSRIGKLVLSVGLPEKYARVLEEAGSVNRISIERERQSLGVDHVAVGASLLEHWKLPAVVFDSIRHQLRPQSAPTRECRLLAEAILVGQAVADRLIGIREDVAEPLRAAPPDLLLPRDAESIDPWLTALQETLREMATAMSISLDTKNDESELQSRATELIAELSLVTAAENQSIQEENRTLEKKARLDPLTGVFNRSAFDGRLREELASACKTGRPTALLMLDVDHFKKINDTYGHVAGDGVLKTVCKLSASVLRPGDFLARYGGEEFAVVAPATDLPQAAAVAERLRKAIEGARHDEDGVTISVTASLGIAVFQEAGTEIEPQLLIKAADSALYEAKRRGRNRCWFSKASARKSPLGDGGDRTVEADGDR